ncbi:hypothetical protein PUW24_01175 [Paenibacillus urinalis]|uniref:DUF3679 domain-containing protein n=1 Tax=Paenibacillus urinalis TaxID=521520 RepID=A0AAX3MWF3_9BACL|nr:MULTISPECIES: hypothetical protein [Paenibacillus]WDH81602.1 hypothetical protein PUW23_19065 [Paenibacillus urinalis]WDH97645.1 hypothetical protein PUW24_01175 [Paenibacillus urinalis]WDI01319.1 hypothetical protein PUW25_18910 [Paenibacillus urinalis]GAK39611.1 hypothetical protein TCA2_2100 [Paenibacillus sp. TCA20]
MAAFGKRLIIFAILLILGMLMGMQIAGSGFSIEEQQGQGVALQQQLQQEYQQEQAAQSGDLEQTVSASLPEAQPQIVTPRDVLTTEPAKASAVDVLAEKTAGLLQQVSQSGIRWVVSLFNGVTE